MPHGNTPEGTAWLMKALHPADATPPWAGIPTGNSEPTVVMEYESVIRIAPNAGAVGTWECGLNLLPNPVQPLSASTLDSVGVLTWGVMNQTLYSSGTAFGVAVANLENLAAYWRMTHMSVTAELDAPALTNQGTVVSAQIPFVKTTLNPSWVNLVDAPVAGDIGKLIVGGHIDCVDNLKNQLNYQTLAAKPMGYTGLAKDGLYQVLKLEPSTEWAATLQSPYLLPTGYSGSANAPWRGMLLPKTTYSDCFPFYGGNLPAGDRVLGCFCNPATTYLLSGSRVPQLLNPLFGRSVFYNLDVAAALTCRVRWGVEYIVPPSSTLAPAMKAAAPLDELAIQTYGRLAAIEPDAYPASYNSWDKLSGFLKSAYRAVRPVLAGMGMIPGPVGIAATGGQMLGDMLVGSQERPPQVVPLKDEEPLRKPKTGKKKQGSSSVRGVKFTRKT